MRNVPVVRREDPRALVLEPSVPDGARETSHHGAEHQPAPWTHHNELYIDPVSVEPNARFAAAVDARDITEVVRIFRSSWHLLMSGNLDDLRRTVHRIPAADRNEQPLLLMCLAVVALPSRLRRPASLRYFLQATRVAHAQQRAGTLDPVDHALLAVGEAVAYRFVRLGTRPVESAHDAAAALQQLDDEQLRSVGCAAVLFEQVGRSLVAIGDIDEALTVFEDGLAVISPNDQDFGYSNLAMLAGIHALRGNLVLAHEYVEVARDAPWAADKREGYSGLYYVLAEAILALERFNHEEASRQLARLNVDMRTIENWVELAQLKSATALVARRPHGALDELDRDLQLHSRDARRTTTRTPLAHARGVLKLALGNVPRAETIIQREGGSGSERFIGLARAALSRNDPAEALRLLRMIDVDQEHPRNQFEAAVIEVAAVEAVASPNAVGDRGRERAVHRLARIAEQTQLRLALGLLTPHDFRAVKSALTAHGYGHLYEGIPIAPLFVQSEVTVGLSERETVVFEALANGLSIAQIARDQFVSTNTIKSQVRSIYKKLGVSTRDEISALATTLGHSKPKGMDVTR